MQSNSKKIFLSLVSCAILNAQECITTNAVENERYNSSVIMLRDNYKKCLKEKTHGQSEIHPLIYIVGGIVFGIGVGNIIWNRK